MLRAFDCSFDLWRLHMSLIFWFNHHSRSRSASHLWTLWWFGLCLEIIIIFMVSRDNLLLNLWLCHTSFKGNPTGPISKWQKQSFLILLARQCILQDHFCHLWFLQLRLVFTIFLAVQKDILCSCHCQVPWSLLIWISLRLKGRISQLAWIMYLPRYVLPETRLDMVRHQKGHT